MSKEIHQIQEEFQFEDAKVFCEEKARLLAEVVRKAIEWAAMEQHPDAIIHHLGVSLDLHPDFYLKFMPVASSHPKSVGSSIFCINIRYREFNGERVGFFRPEIDLIRSSIETVLPVVNEWNGMGCDSVSMAVNADVHPSLIKALRDNYNGCPYGKNPNKDKDCRGVFCSCDLRKKGYELAHQPIIV